MRIIDQIVISLLKPLSNIFCFKSVLIQIYRYSIILAHCDPKQVVPNRIGSDFELFSQEIC